MSSAETSDPNASIEIPADLSCLGEDVKQVRTLPDMNAAHLQIRQLFNTRAGRMLSENICFLNGEPYRISAAPFCKGLRRYLRLHRFLQSPRSRRYNYIDYCYYMQDPLTRLMDFKPQSISLIQFDGRRANIVTHSTCPSPKMPPIILGENNNGQWYFVINRFPMHKCPQCGSYWREKHSCDLKKASFYHHIIHRKHGERQWQHVPFRCPAQPQQFRQMFVTYDIETYTVFENKGKRMHPFMLCFTLSGDPQMVMQARRQALKDVDIRRFRDGYYWIHTRPGVVAKKFRAFRNRLQEHFSKELIRRYYYHNRQLFDQLMLDTQVSSIYDIPYSAILEHKKELRLPEDFCAATNVVILGHNICKFDELLLAAELVENREELPRAGKCERMFMPRVGRLLFNDVTFMLPNPLYRPTSKERLQRWMRGILNQEDLENVYVKFAVRDTLQLTSGAALRKAAQAYALPLSKGECPYEAINEHISYGSFETDQDGFPAARYWDSQQVLEEQKALWRQNHGQEPYDLIHACLEYCMLDVEVTQALAHTLYNSYDQYFRQELDMAGRYNIFERPTIPSNTHAFWKQLAFSDYARERLANPRIRSVSTDYVAELYAPYRHMFQHIRQALRGGRCYPTVLGPYSQPVYVFDICGMYASALTHPMPHGLPLDPHNTARFVDLLNGLLSHPEKISYFDSRILPSILKIDAHPPPMEMLDPLPPLCSRKGGRLVWTNEPLYEEVVTIIDILILHNRGWSVVVRQDELNICFPEWKPICAAYVGKNIAAKEKADREKNEVMRSISKMLSNALYGAFATNMDTTRVVFEQDLGDTDRNNIYYGTTLVKHITVLQDNSLSGQTVLPAHHPQQPRFSAPYLQQYFHPQPEEESDQEEAESLTQECVLDDVEQELENALEAPLFITSDEDSSAPSEHHAACNNTQFKPMTMLDAPPEAMTVLHLEELDRQVPNKRYATQIACFVLGWSRAFFSDWCEIIHGPDLGTHPHERAPQSLYGDTDSLFVTQSGYERMRTRGAHRIKGPHTRLTFDPAHPALYWACDCDIKCKKCGADTYSSESIFLAPKLYGLKDAVCTNPQCGHVGQGKIRSKGHRQAELVYDTLLKCWSRHEDQLYGGVSHIPELNTRRQVFKTTLLNKVSRYEPFSIHNEPLVRILRPWKDQTLYRHGDYLYPYDISNPNPRTAQDVRVADTETLQPEAQRYPLAILSAEDCDQILSAFPPADNH